MTLTIGYNFGEMGLMRQINDSLPASIDPLDIGKFLLRCKVSFRYGCVSGNFGKVDLMSHLFNTIKIN